MANHVVLLGDSIFDNKSYVGSGPAVIDQLRQELPSGWQATLLAVDGSVTADVAPQLRRLPRDASHLVVSVGGNDALRESGILAAPARSAAEVFAQLADVRDRFGRDYAKMLQAILGHKLPTVLCTVYDPNYDDAKRQRLAVAGLAVFNDVIGRAAARHGLPLVDLRLVFSEAKDYANPIEPSPAGGVKIARLVRDIATGHDFGQRRSAIYV